MAAWGSGTGFAKRRLTLWLVAGLIALLGTPPAQAQFVKSLEQDQGTFYRLKVKLAYKGEPQNFDIVVGCNVRITNYLGGGNSYEVGLIPTVFGRRMSDGKGLVVRPPNACRGQTTANGRVQPDLLPVIVVYNDANTLDFGIAYLSEDAYEGPLSALSFGGATIEKATRKEFDEFRRTQTNLVTRELYHSTFDSDQLLRDLKLTRISGRWAHVCEGYARYQVPEDLQNLVRQYWPDARATYWIPTGNGEIAIRSAIASSNGIRSGRSNEPLRNWRNWTIGDPDIGLPTRTGGGQMFAHRGISFPSTTYPSSSDFRRDNWPIDPKDWSKYVARHDKLAEVAVDFRGGRTNGFGYCYVYGGLTGGELSKSEFASKRITARVDDEQVFSTHAHFLPPLWIFERDEYALNHFRIYLESTRGDV